MNVSVSAKVDTDLLDALSRGSVKLEAAVLDVIYKGLKRAEWHAKREHRYKRKTGKLTRATQAELNQKGGALYISDSLAHYGKYVHEGHKRWAPDKFLPEALNRVWPAVDKQIDNVITQMLG